jgi:hypothetical protein
VHDSGFSHLLTLKRIDHCRNQVCAGLIHCRGIFSPVVDVRGANKAECVQNGKKFTK